MRLSYVFVKKFYVREENFVKKSVDKILIGVSAFKEEHFDTSYSSME